MWNPAIEFDGSIWETDDYLPRRHERGLLSGKILVSDDNHAVFIADDGFELSYERLMGFSSMHCGLLG